MSGPAVSAIVLNYQGGSAVLEAVESLLAQDVSGLEVVVVDNASTDGSADAVERRFGDRVRVLRNPRNLGYGAGNNVGIRATSGRHVLLLNNDATAAPGLVRALLRAAEADPRVGMVAARVLSAADPSVVDTTGHLLYPDGLNRGRGRLERDDGRWAEEAEALFPSGAAGLYRRSMLDEIGLFDETFFLYGDDAELGLRGRVAGWRCAFAPDAVALHRYSMSAGAYSELKAFYVERNRVLVLVKLFPWPLVLASPVHTAARLAVQAWGALRGRGAAGRFARERSALRLPVVLLRAWASALRALPGALAARRAFRSRRRLTTAQFRDLLGRYRIGVRELALKD